MKQAVTPEAAALAVSRLGLMAFFPGDPDTRAALIWVLMQLVETEEQLDWLVERALKLYARWPGPGELRALYCSRFKPKDGAEAYSEMYQSGFPHESARPEIPAKREVVTTADGELADQIRSLAHGKSLPAGKSPLYTRKELQQGYRDMRGK